MTPKTPFELFGFEIGPGWVPLVEELMTKLKGAGWNGEIGQVKEKFGGLRFYIYDGNPAVWDLINKYETKSYTICEDCGLPGKLRHGGWWRTLCDTHHQAG